MAHILYKILFHSLAKKYKNIHIKKAQSIDRAFVVISGGGIQYKPPGIKKTAIGAPILLTQKTFLRALRMLTFL